MALSREDLCNSLDALPATALNNDIWPMVYDFLATHGYEDVLASLAAAHTRTGVFNTGTLALGLQTLAVVQHINVQRGRAKSTRR